MTGIALGNILLGRLSPIELIDDTAQKVAFCQYWCLLVSIHCFMLFIQP